MNVKLLKRTSVLTALSSVIMTAPEVFSQESQGYIEETVVTARQRQESIQNVPVAVTALSGDFIENKFAENLGDLDKYMPNVQLESMQFGGGALTTSIRGVSYDAVEKANEPPVGVSVDGIFFSSNSGGMVDMFDIESVEVLRGPQGTLFGRNTMGGDYKYSAHEAFSGFRCQNFGWCG